MKENRKDGVNKNEPYNMGDLRVPVGVKVEPAKRVFVIGKSEAVIINYSDFDTRVLLYPNGGGASEADEQEVLDETKRSWPKNS